MHVVTKLTSRIQNSAPFVLEIKPYGIADGITDAGWQDFFCTAETKTELDDNRVISLYLESGSAL
jgi:hypothetical protein